MPNQMNRDRWMSRVGRRWGSSSRRAVELTPSAATTRSRSANSSQVGHLPLERQLDPDARGSGAGGSPAAAGGRWPRTRGRRSGRSGRRRPDVDGAPAGEGVGDLGVARVVGVAQRPEGLLREHHPPAEGGVGGVALDHGDLMGRVGPLGQQGEVQPGRPAAQDTDAHRRPPPSQPRTSARRSSWAGSETVGSRTRSSQPASSYPRTNSLTARPLLRLPAATL